MEQSLIKRQDDEAKFLACCMSTDNFQDKIRGIGNADKYFSKIEYSELFTILMRGKTGSSINFDFIIQGLTAKGVNTTFFPALYSKSIPSNHIDFYFNAVKTAYMRQKTKDLINHTVSKLKAEGSDINEVLSDISKNLSLLQETTNESKTYHVAECLEGGMEIINNKLFSENGLVGLSSGIDAYDKITRGFQGGRMYVVGARPSYGKTTLGINFAGQVGLTAPTPFFTLEMSRFSLAAKLIQIKGKIDLYETNDKVKRDYAINKADALDILYESNIFINDSSYQTIETFSAEVRKLHREGKM